jgi:tRNA (guanine37-N1)-methyltransferase
MKIDILTIFPEMFEQILGASIIGRAQANGIVEIKVSDIRECSTDKHNRTDMPPFGGGAGQLMNVQPVFDAIRKVKGLDSGTTPRMTGRCRYIYMSPRGRVLDPSLVHELAESDEILILCGHYEGMDQRVLDYFEFEEVSIGDYVLTGGELPAMVLVDAVARLLPGTLGSDESHDEESIYSGLLEYPQYTRPAEFEDLTVPEVLLSGHHKEIHLWQFRKSLELTAERRPDLFEAYVEKHSPLDKDEQKILEEVVKSAF